jgi:hypothetical protein
MNWIIWYKLCKWRNSKYTDSYSKWTGYWQGRCFENGNITEKKLTIPGKLQGYWQNNHRCDLFDSSGGLFCNESVSCTVSFTSYVTYRQHSPQRHFSFSTIARLVSQSNCFSTLLWNMPSEGSKRTRRDWYWMEHISFWPMLMMLI